MLWLYTEGLKSPPENSENYQHYKTQQHTQSHTNHSTAVTNTKDETRDMRLQSALQPLQGSFFFFKIIFVFQENFFFLAPHISFEILIWNLKIQNLQPSAILGFGIQIFGKSGLLFLENYFAFILLDCSSLSVLNLWIMTTLGMNNLFTGIT